MNKITLTAAEEKVLCDMGLMLSCIHAYRHSYRHMLLSDLMCAQVHFWFCWSAIFCHMVRSDSQNVINSDVLLICSCWRILSAKSTLILLVWQWKKVHSSVRKEITVSTKGLILWMNCSEHRLEDLNFISRTMMSLFSINWELQQGTIF